jgi:UDP-3-O-[3-hydroxymyristoyl] glucosamine N-acyltransferase
MFTLAELAQRFGLERVGEGEVRIGGVCSLSPGKPGHLSFLANPRNRGQLASTHAAAVVVSREAAGALPGNGLVAADPHLAFARIAQLFDPDREFVAGTHASAVIAADATIADGCHIGPLVVVESGARIGPGCFLGPGCIVGRDANLGGGSRLEARVWIGPRTSIGQRAHIHPGAVIGSRGFGLARTPKGWEEVPQLGRVMIGDDVEIGANTTIDRGAIEDTVIEDGVKLDNQIQIAHNCHIGAHTAIAAVTGIAGSTRIGRRCMIGGAAAISGHLQIADDVVVLGGGMVTKSLTRPGVYGSVLPAEDARHWRKTVVRIRRLEQYETRLKHLEKQLNIAVQDEEAPGEDDV